ncbi:hypothetical protein [Adhaeribacter terreus]|uniref:Uncharacterized protein n=1 Tax=Adhaeribacter terreus TaxID=529703 RepID=A0ABW0E9Z2_9BACT
MGIKNYQQHQQVSVLFRNFHSEDISHAVLFENDDAFQKLMGGNFKITRRGADVFLQISSETELLHLRQITRIPLFMKF